MAKRKKNKKHHPQWLQRLQLNTMVMAASLYIWILRLTCRIDVVTGDGHVDAAIARGVIAPCCWHQQIIASSLFLLRLMPRGLRLGFLISPSREGEFIARVAMHHRTETMRGSSSRTGREALKALIQGTQQGISPTIYADGPRGPARVFKPGAVMLSRRTGTPIMPVGCAASSYWQFNSWDKTQIPKPFARITIAVGEPWSVGRREHKIDDLAQQAGRQINELTEIAQAAHQ